MRPARQLTGCRVRRHAWSGSFPAPRVEAVVVGGGQAGLAAAYQLQKRGVPYVVLDANETAGGAWGSRWQSLRLFSTKYWSSLPGLPFYGTSLREADEYPSTYEMQRYLRDYEEHFNLRVMRPVGVRAITRNGCGGGGVAGNGGSGDGLPLAVHTNCGNVIPCRAVISATGTHTAPLVPEVPGAEKFRGTQVHSSQYAGAEAMSLQGKRVVVVGEGNSGAQILAEVAAVAAEALWVTAKEPRILPEEMSGKAVFDLVAERRKQNGGVVSAEDIPSLHSIICVPSVAEAKRGGLYNHSRRSFNAFSERGVVWTNPEGGVAEEFPADVVIWATGYGSSTGHLAGLGIVAPDSTVAVDENLQAVNCPGVFMLGYGNWAGVGSGSIPGAAMFAKKIAIQVAEIAKDAAVAPALEAAAAAAAQKNSPPPRSIRSLVFGGGAVPQLAFG